LGFSIEEIRQLLSLWQDKQRASREVRQVASRHVAELEQRIAQLQSMRETLVALMDGCSGDDRPTCPILSDLAGEPCSGAEHHCH
ncbi:MAG TPA: MerR family DNA-binding protein, partial [Burkholderiaceae bacterium]|nr:MerR family DNA-binding protein [Burkholderiaceae bacterium]